MQSKTATHRMEKVFANHISDMGLIPRIYRELLKLNSKRTNHLIKRWTKDLYTDIVPKI